MRRSACATRYACRPDTDDSDRMCRKLRFPVGRSDHAAATALVGQEFEYVRSRGLHGVLGDYGEEGLQAQRDRHRMFSLARPATNPG